MFLPKKIIEIMLRAKYNNHMVENIKEIIAEASRELFNAEGYQKVTMRQIADRCGISVGNLTYHYPHKEDLLMLEHDGILNAFLDNVLTTRKDLSGLKGYFTVECAFLYRILQDSPVAALYTEVINVPNLRRRYCISHHRLYQHFCPEVPDKGNEWVSTVAMSALEFQLVDEGILSDFAVNMEKVFCARVLFEGKNPFDYKEIIHEAVENGVALAIQLNQAY